MAGEAKKKGSVLSEDTPDEVFVNPYTEGLGDRLRNPRTSESWMTLLQLHNSLDEFLRRSLRAELAFSAR